jgi:hypothetical protein
MMKMNIGRYMKKILSDNFKEEEFINEATKEIFDYDLEALPRYKTIKIWA